MNRSLRFITLAATAALTVGCSDSDQAGSVPSENTLVFTRADQSRIAFSTTSQLYVWCGAWEEGAIPAQTVHVLFTAPAPANPGWQLRAVVADVTVGAPLTFPNNFLFNQPRKADIFINDPPNELSSSVAQSTGSITFQHLQCGTGGQVQFSIAAVIGSELNGGQSVAVAGTFSAPIGQKPF